jgi:hypothetical protein
VIVVRVKVSRGIVSFSQMGTDSADTSQPPNGEICKDKSPLLPNNPARQQYRYTSVPIEAHVHLNVNVILYHFARILFYY